MGAGPGPDVLDKTVAFLGKRDGIDKLLKIIRYTTKFVCATTYAGSTSELALRLNAFESSIGTSRKAYRLGKFLQDVNKLRRTPLTLGHAWLEVLANGGEGVYYFVEQFTWLVKAGLLDERHSPRLSKVSAWAELVGYVASITLSTLRIAAGVERELALVQELRRRKKEGEQEEGDALLAREVAMLQRRRHLHQLAIVQDFADLMMAVHDIKGGKGALSHPAVLALAGLLSALISANKNWPSS